MGDTAWWRMAENKKMCSEEDLTCSSWERKVSSKDRLF